MRAGTAREEDQTAAVSLEALNINGEGFGGEVCSSRVNADTDGRGQFSGYFSFLFSSISYQASKVASPSFRYLSQTEFGC